MPLTTGPGKFFGLQLLPPATPEHPAHSPPIVLYTTIMDQKPSVVPRNVCHEPYPKPSRSHRGLPPPKGNKRAKEVINGRIYELLEDLNDHYGPDGLPELLHGHAEQGGLLGEAIKKWLRYDAVSSLLNSSLWPPPDWSAAG
jgi:hypothetical protein